MSEIGVAGAGFSGAVVARQLAEAGHHVTVFDPRSHVAGNCHTARDPITGVLVHEYGPHIFHTADDEVWAYVQRFGTWRRYQHRVKATAGGRVYGLPINLHTLNQYFGTAMGPAEARRFVATKSETRDPVVSFEDRALATVGRELYELLLAGYTRKQWGRDPAELPASVLARLPVRFTYDDAYFDHPHQALPVDGYTAVVEAIVDHPGVEVRLGEAIPGDQRFDHVVWTGPIDAYFDGSFGELGYRTLDFERATHDGDVQGCPVMNYCDADVAFTRVTEFRHFTPWEEHTGSVTFTEFSRAAGPDDIPYYPVRLVGEQQVLADYVAAARTTAGVTFVGRLGTYRYLDMDRCIREALDVSSAIALALAASVPPPIFSADPTH